VCERNQGTRLDRIWNEIENVFEAGDASVRVHLFKSLKEPAFFQPLRVLRLIRRALEKEAATVQLWSDYLHSFSRLLRFDSDSLLMSAGI
jgi:hypothetical protein